MASKRRRGKCAPLSRDEESGMYRRTLYLVSDTKYKSKYNQKTAASHDREAAAPIKPISNYIYLFL